jgi:hypothetical protein
MINLLEFKNYNGLPNLSEGLQYHYDNQISLMGSVYRIGSEAWIDLVKEARTLWESNSIELNEDDIFLISTDVGERAYYEGKMVYLDVPFEDIEMNEAEYRGKKVKLNKPFRTPGGPRKFSVYTKNGSGRVVKVSFGQPGMRVNNADKKRAVSFRKRMQCDNPGPKWKPRYWACNVSRYSKLLGLKSNRPW